MSKELTTRELHTIRKKMWDASMQNHAKYFDSETGLFDEKFTEKRSCPVCRATNDRQLFTKSGGVYVACNDCGMVFLNPVFKDACIEEYYRKNHEVQCEIVESDNAFYTQLYARGLRLISNHFSSPGNILDIGCSAGAFLDIAKKFQWKTYGLELNAKEAVYSRKKGHIVYEETINKAKLQESFDAITLWDVFEHIKDGAGLLKDAKKLLNKNGIVFLQSPTYDSIAAKILQSKCNMFDGLEHVNLYGYQTILKLAEYVGYEVVNFETVISEIGVINNYLNFDDPYLGNTKEKNLILGILDENLIHSHKLGYKFQTCLRLK